MLDQDSPRWSTTWGWNQPAPENPVISFATYVAALSAVEVTVGAVGLLVAAIADVGGWDHAAIVLTVAVIGSALLHGWLVGHYETPEAQERQEVAPLRDDAPLTNLHEVGGRLVLGWLLLSLPIAAALLVWNGAAGMALLVGIGAGGLVGAAQQRRRDLDRGWGMYTEPRLFRRNEKPYWFIGRATRKTDGSN